MEILYITNKMRLIMIFIVNNALHVSGVHAHHQELMNCVCSLWYSLVVPNGRGCSIQFPFGVVVLVYLFCLFGIDEFYIHGAVHR